jgi:hypothetical protein
MHNRTGKQWEDWDSNPRTTKDRILSPAELASFPILPHTDILIVLSG